MIIEAERMAWGKDECVHFSCPVHELAYSGLANQGRNLVSDSRAWLSTDERAHVLLLLVFIRICP